MNDIVRDGLFGVCVCVCNSESLSIPSLRPCVGRCCLSCAKGSHSSLSHALFCQKHPGWVLGVGGQLTMNVKPREVMAFHNVHNHVQRGHILVTLNPQSQDIS